MKPTQHQRTCKIKFTQLLIHYDNNDTIHKQRSTTHLDKYNTLISIENSTLENSMDIKYCGKKTWKNKKKIKKKLEQLATGKGRGPDP